MVKKKTLGRIIIIYNVIVVSIFLIWVYSVQKREGALYPSDHFSELLLFGILLLIGGGMSAVRLAAEKNGADKVSKAAVIGGIVIAVFFLLWGLAF